MYREDMIKYHLNALNEQFKALETYGDLKDFQKEMKSYPQGYRLRMKRSGYEAYGFKHLYDEDALAGENPHANDPKYENKVRYLLSDGNSTRESYIKNLHRNIEVYY